MLENERYGILSRLFSPQPSKRAPHTMDVVYQFGTIKHAILYSILFAPTFFEVEGSVLFDNGNPLMALKFAKSKQQWKDEVYKLEASYNLVEIPYLFVSGLDEETLDEDVETLGRHIVEVWDALLHRRYAGREFVVELLSPIESGDVHSIRFFEVRAPQ